MAFPRVPSNKGRLRCFYASTGQATSSIQARRSVATRQTLRGILTRMVLVHHEFGQITYVSETIAQLFCDTRRRVVGSAFRHVRAWPTMMQAAAERYAGLREDFLLEDLVLRRPPTGLSAAGRSPGSPVQRCGRFVGYRGSASISRRTHILGACLAAARYDALTGLPNRRAWRRCWARTRRGRASEEACAVLLIDLDRFKKVNDTLGHPAATRS
jgi:GGDEF domain-containing protein